MIESNNEPNKTVDNKLELIQSFSRVESKIKDSISSDYVLAKLNEKERTMIVEMTSNAFYGAKLIKAISENHKVWSWNKKRECWELKYMDKEGKKTLQEFADALFQSFMVKPTMVAILKRNVEDNYLVRWALDVQENLENEESLSNEKMNIMERLKNNLRNEEY